MEAAKTLSLLITDCCPLLPRVVISVSSVFVFGMLLLYCLLWVVSYSGIFTAVDTLLYYNRPKVVHTAINSKNDFFFFLVNKTNLLRAACCEESLYLPDHSFLENDEMSTIKL